MDIIRERAEELTSHLFVDTVLPQHTHLKNQVSEYFEDIDDKRDRLTFLQILIQANINTFSEHECGNPECEEPKKHRNISYFLNQEVRRLGIVINEKTFTIEEKEAYEKRIDDLLSQLEYIKLQNEAMYDGIMEELNELKDLFFLGKKTWSQLLLGKVAEMTAGGIISETVSKQIITSFEDMGSKLIS